ncbi:MAG: DNA polymerase, partial [Candidatus Omnitrophica bacterium]|nr:DNA polymerase [Candidatus Omnitrophota bacterium]
MPKPKLFLIDATAFCYRAFYALAGLSTSFGQPTNAIYGFINMLNRILKEKKPDYLAVCFDVSRDTFRARKFAEYKIQRPPMPDGLSAQIPLIKQVVSAYGIAIFEKEGFEADDIIATCAKVARGGAVTTTIISSDKDMLQLVDDKTFVFSPYEEEGMLYDENKVSERFGVSPRQIADIITLTGDSADNIPGISGISKKVALELIHSFGSVEELLKHIDKIKEEKIKDIITDNIDKIKLNKELADLEKDVDIGFSLDKAAIRKPDFKELFRLFKYLEFKKFLKDLPCEEDKKEVAEVENIKDDILEDFLNSQDELFLCGGRLDDLVFYAKTKFFRVGDFDANARNILADPKIKKISHDLKKMKVALAREGIVLDGLYFDTMVAGYLLNPSKPEYKLADLAWDYLGERYSTQAIDNPRATGLILELAPRLEKELREKQLFNLFRDLEMPLVGVLATMELSGIKLDLKVLAELSGDIEHKLVKLIEDIYALSGTQFNINSPKQLREVLFEKLKLPVGKKTKTGPSTNEEVLRQLADKHKLPALLLEYRQLMKLKNTYVDTLPTLVDKKTGRVHTSFNQTATETGRLSSSSPTLQNLPIKTDIGKNIRRAIISS